MIGCIIYEKFYVIGKCIFREVDVARKKMMIPGGDLYGGGDDVAVYLAIMIGRVFICLYNFHN